MKKILIFLFVILLSSCTGNKENMNKSSESNIKEKISSETLSSEKKKRKD